MKKKQDQLSVIYKYSGAKSKVTEKDILYHVNSNQMKAGVAVLISNKTIQTVGSEKGCFKMIKRSVLQEHITIIDVPNN